MILPRHDSAATSSGRCRDSPAKNSPGFSPSLFASLRLGVFALKGLSLSVQSAKSVVHFLFACGFPRCAFWAFSRPFQRVQSSGLPCIRFPVSSPLPLRAPVQTLVWLRLAVLRILCFFAAYESVSIGVNRCLRKMSDVFTKAKRSEVMARIRSRGNRETEVALAKLLRSHGITGWRRHWEIRKVESRKQNGESSRRRFAVRPDFVFRRSRTAVFVDGCFWHGCPKHATRPKNNRAFWQRKLAANKKRDQLVTRTLRKAGWRVVRIWECALRRNPEGCVERLKAKG